MKIQRHDPAAGLPESDPIFVGEVTKQTFVSDDDAALLRVNSVTFKSGARNRWHRHGADQVLVVTHGIGIVAIRGEEATISAGDVVLIPAGEVHWHGAKPGHDMTHLSILTPGPLTIEDNG